MRKGLAICWVLLLFGAQPLAAQDYQKGWAAFQKGDYAIAFQEWQALAESGHATSQFNIGLMHAKGLGVPRDYAEAVRWYRRAAEQGHIDAQNNLGFMYGMGRGVEQNHAEAVMWLRRAALQGDADAQYNLGVMYTKGRGLPRNDAMATRWYQRAANQGQPKAIEALEYLSSRRPKADAQTTTVPLRPPAPPADQANKTDAKRAPAKRTVTVPPAAATQAKVWGKALTSGPEAPSTAPPKVSQDAANGIAPAPESGISAAASPPSEPQADTTMAARRDIPTSPQPVQVRTTAPDKPQAPEPAPASGTGPASTPVAAAKDPSGPAQAGNVAATDTPPATAKAMKEEDKAATRTASAADRGVFRVQLSSVKTKARAAEEASRLTDLYKPVLGSLKVEPVRADLGDRGIFYRLRAGPLADRDAAASICRKLSARNQGCLVVTR